MANIKSAIKKVRVNQRNYRINRSYKSTIKTLVKKYFALIKNHKTKIEKGNLDDVRLALSSIYSKIDKAVKKRVIHRNTGSRKKSRLAKHLKSLIMA